MSDEHISFTVKFEKASVKGDYVRGFASVAVQDGKPVYDFEGDHIPLEVLAEAAHDFIAKGREGKVYHRGAKVGEIVESVMVDDDFAKALGMTDTRRGWWIGMKVNAPHAQEGVRSGDLLAFSIGGSGVREEVA